MNFLSSLQHALHGLATIWHREPNFRTEVFCGLLVIAASYVIGIARFEWVVVLFLIFAVLLCEIANSVMEAVIDLLSPRYHALAKQIKDMMAGATLLMSVAAVIIGLWIFVPYAMN